VRPHTLFISLAASLVCVGCTSSATAPSAPNPSGPPALESPPPDPAGAKLPTVAEPVNLNPVDFSADITIPYIGYLRQKIDRPFGADSIETIGGFGYRLRTEEAP
jgi:hypothetical protein